MPSQRETLTTKRDKLLTSINEKGNWSLDSYNEVIDIQKRISEMPDDQLKLDLRRTKKPR